MTTRSRVTVQIRRHFEVPATALFDAWLNPDGAWRWMARGYGDLLHLDLQPWVHGIIRQVVLQEGREIEHRGEIIELARPTHLAFTWQGPPPATDGHVRLVFIADATGTELSLEQERVPQGHESRTLHAWNIVLDAIARSVARAVPIELA
ncbi:MAG TPA: SRPBCC domain-containing protein [Polyangiaceae bacterium]|nr:SRPBCC domain-containing protein [Polyangiaceae bacterium]